MTFKSEEKWRPFNCFFSPVGLRTYHQPCSFNISQSTRYTQTSLDKICLKLQSEFAIQLEQFLVSAISNPSIKIPVFRRHIIPRKYRMCGRGVELWGTEMRSEDGSAFIRFQSLSQMEFAFTAVVSFRGREENAKPVSQHCVRRCGSQIYCNS